METDAGAIAELCGVLGYRVDPEHARARLAQRGEEDELFVAEEDGLAVGWIEVSVEHALTLTKPSVVVTGLVVAEPARGRGVGRALVERVGEWAREHGCRTVRVRSRVEREGAHRFYESLGFEHVKTQAAFRLDL